MNFKTITLILFNLLPLFGVYYWGWEIGHLLFLYWCESGVIGVVNLFKLYKIPESRGANLSLFVVHYGGTMIIHLIFLSLLIIFATKKMPFYLEGEWEKLEIGIFVVLAFVHELGEAHTHFIKNGAFKRTAVGDQMVEPYHRVILMNLVILGAGCLMIIFGDEALKNILLLVLVGLKIAFELNAQRAAASDT